LPKWIGHQLLIVRIGEKNSSRQVTRATEVDGFCGIFHVKTGAMIISGPAAPARLVM
jgi:hypothetical protein